MGESLSDLFVVYILVCIHADDKSITGCSPLFKLADQIVAKTCPWTRLIRLHVDEVPFVLLVG